MKKLMLVLSMMLASAAFVNAQDTTSAQSDRSSQYSTQDQSTTQDQNWDMSDKDMIATSELPQSVQDQLRSQDYSGWTLKNAYRKMKNNETVYAVELGNGDQVKKLKFDAQGNVLKEKTKKDKD